MSTGRRAHVWDDPTSGRSFLIVRTDDRDRAAVYDGTQRLDGWWASWGRAHCVCCGGWTRLRYRDECVHPGCHDARIDAELDALDQAAAAVTLPPRQESR